MGGGQIFGQLADVMSKVLESQARAKMVAWGVGLPLQGTNDNLVKGIAGYFSLFGTRNYEWKDELNFVPCASCLARCFDQVPLPTNDLVFYVHRRKGTRLEVPDGAPVMSNAWCTPQHVIDFIASGDTVVTSSYHGVYWAQLLGRKVICLPYNAKFKTFQHPPTVADASNWQEHVSKARRTHPLLEEYRALNLSFAMKVAEVYVG
nr:hypothetical protein [Roseovarius amoyensis]